MSPFLWLWPDGRALFEHHFLLHVRVKIGNDVGTETESASLKRTEATKPLAQAVTAACAAVSMSLTTSCGWETIATWFVGTSTVVAPMRLANRRSASGGIA